ncbi:dihydroxyacetone kinase subunit DhaK [Starkeya koreensis]|uniref:Dihydroxyacetone kinase subunit DhaK n=1 Tax=Ancylobacter koreensis TaxID=266121 RepID=A0ABT0DIS0_9HYPH|nr:dihydroxyacetone kinase subunit DhaK [Ancylobacter koreensis]MCK0207099.1 dihydroxyacetone kinase subunit DhaK [Ancylobacter koreensis]
MKRIMNAPGTLVAESLAGFVAAHEDLVAFGGEGRFVRRRALVPGKVALISGGGAGHEPLHCGFIGQGMLDAACTGHVFTSPTPDQILAAMDETDTGAGCLLVVKNYDGDVMNFEMAAEMAAGRHRVEMVVVEDDAASGPSVRSRGRRGVAGTVVVEKILGAAAERGDDLSSLKALGEGLSGRMRSMGVALRGVTVPDNARETFALGPEEMEIGVGIHGEPGLYRARMAGADEIVRLICEPILDQLGPLASARPLLIVNGFGGTPPIELHLAYGLARRYLAGRGVAPARSLVGTFVTSLDMAGLSVTLALLSEAEFALWCAPVATPVLAW